jgi:hypothetical protein
MRTLLTWSSGSLPRPEQDEIVAQVSGRKDCFIAAITREGVNSLVSGTTENVTDDPRKTLECIAALSSSDLLHDNGLTTETLANLELWVEQNSLEESLNLRYAGIMSRRRLARRISYVTSRLPAHLRVGGSPLADKALSAIARDYGAADERRIVDLEESFSSDGGWLREVVDLAKTSRRAKAESKDGSGFVIRALLIGRKV